MIGRGKRRRQGGRSVRPSVRPSISPLSSYYCSMISRVVLQQLTDRLIDGTGRTKDPDSSTARASRGNNRRQLSPSAGRGRVSAAASFQTLRCTRALTARNTHSPPAPPASYKASADRGTGRRMQGPGERRVELTDTPTSMLPGISRKRKMRSKF